MAYEATLSRVERYFDSTATAAWEALTSDAPVSRVRETVRAGRDAMRAKLLARLPDDLSGARVLDAGCGTGAMSEALARRGAEVVGADISPALLDVARRRMPGALSGRVRFVAGDMLSDDLGSFDHVVAMDSLLYYGRADLVRALARLSRRTRGSVLFTVAPRTPLLTAMLAAGKLMPRADRSPVMVPHGRRALERGLGRPLADLGRVRSGFYISHALELAS